MAAKSVKSIVIDNVRYEVKRRLTEMGFNIVPKSSKKFWAIKPITENEVASIVQQITRLVEVGWHLDGGPHKTACRFSYALLNERKTVAETIAAGISIEI